MRPVNGPLFGPRSAASRFTFASTSCASFHLPGTVRASPHVFNTKEEIDTLLEGVREIAS